MRHLKRLLLLLVFSLIFPAQLLAWDTDTVHPYITSSALQKSEILDGFLNYFGLANERFDSQDPRDHGPLGPKGWVQHDSTK